MKYSYPELATVLEKNKDQKEIYLPSSFWKKASDNIVDEIMEFGVENFRRLNSPLGYFVPKYGAPTNSFSTEVRDQIYSYLSENGTKKQNLAMKEFLSGYTHALSDYRVLLAADDNSKKPALQSFTESNFGNPVEQFEFDDRAFSRSSLNYLQGLCFLKKFIEQEEEIQTVVEIGGGFGSLGEILKFTPSIKYIDIDIPPVSFIAWYYLSQIYDSKEMEVYLHNKEAIEIDQLKRCTVLNSWDIEKLHGTIDLFVNFISFQEMEPHIVENYLNHIKRLNAKWILLRNMREGKNIKKHKDDIGVEVPVKKDDYLKMLSDQYQLVDTNVFPYGYKTVDGFHSELLLYKRK